jgi:hypothetical protein
LEYRNKLAEKWKGPKNPSSRGLSEERRTYLSELKIGKSWGKHTLETKRIISQKNKRPKTNEEKKNMSLAVIGKTYEQRMGPKIAARMRKFQSKRWKGNKNPNYTGCDYEPYGKNFPKISERIRKKYRYKCIYCGINQNNLNGKLCTHHINYKTSDSRLINLIPLCRKCHTKTLNNRDYWFAFWCYHLNIKPWDLIK